MSAGCKADILVAASDVDERLLRYLADCRATFVRTFDEAQRALREHLFRLVVIDLNFDDVRMFDLLEHVRSLAGFKGVPVLCVQAAEAGAGISGAIDRVVRRLGGEGFVDLRTSAEPSAVRVQRLLERTTPARREPYGVRLCILVIDHDVDAAHWLGEIVEQAGHDVDFAYSGPAGMDAARRLRPDVVFLDLALPHSVVDQLVRHLRAAPDLRNVLVVALACAPADAEQLARMRDAGFDHHIVKPGERHSIQRLLEDLVPQPVR